MSAALDAARQAASAVFAAALYAPVEPPIVAPAEIFLERLGERFRRLTSFFEDGTGEEKCLRPEITIPVCRMAIEAGYDGKAHLKLRYAGPVFRLADDGAGALTESAQVGAEFLGAHDGARAEAEILALTLSALAACGVTRPRVVLGDAGAFADLVRGLKLEPRQQSHLMRLFEAHGSALTAHLPAANAAPDLKPLDGDLALADTLARLESGGLTLTGGRTPEDIARRLADRAGRASAEAISPAARQAIEAFFALAAPLDDAGAILAGFFATHVIESTAPQRLSELAACLAKAGGTLDDIVFDAGVHAPLGYYTGLEFRVDNEAGTAVAGGGRYDALIRELGGPDAPAVGVALFLDVLSGGAS
jgi:ATP phosphoribosyltransferase regulatory subunit